MLPKITHPTTDVTIPSTKKKVRVRPLLVKEEKILLMAKESNDELDVFSALKQVVNNCIVTPNIDVNDMTIFDLEYLFIKIRSFSVSNITNVSYVDGEDEKIYNFAVDLDKLEVIFPEKINNNIKINDEISISLKYPSARLYDDKEFLKKIDNDMIEHMVLACLDKIFIKDEMHDFKEMSNDEIMQFLEELPLKTYDLIKSFFNNMPYMLHTIEYKNSLGNDRKIILSSLTDFFTFR